MTDPTPSAAAVPVCGIGASAGGVEALQQFFGALPDDLGLAYVVVVHLAPDHKSELPAILRRWTTMSVVEVADHEKTKLAPNHVYVIAPDRKLEITDMSVGASPFEQPRGHRTAIDLFFRSLAVCRGDGFAVVLSGAGSDGAVGAKAVRQGGGLVLVQDPDDATHGDMPRAVISTGVADVVLPVRELAAQLASLARDKARLIHAVSAPDSGVPILRTRNARCEAYSTCCESARDTTSRNTSGARSSGASHGGCSSRTRSRSTAISASCGRTSPRCRRSSTIC